LKTIFRSFPSGRQKPSCISADLGKAECSFARLEHLWPKLRGSPKGGERTRVDGTVGVPRRHIIIRSAHIRGRAFRAFER
jgi:hypothetical protein